MPHLQEPPWAVAPSDETWSLTEIKQGVTVAQHALHRPCTVLGRAEDLVHIPVAHESCSRLHARFAFDTSQTLWLRDLGSTHGTFCNKRKLPVEACGPDESNSTTAGARGIVVSPGDVLQFGASTRLYCVEGPADYSRKRKLSLPPVAKTPVPKAVGIIEEAEHTVLEKQQQLVEEEEQEIPEKYRHEYEQIQALRMKLDNIQQESDRIQQKGYDGLTSGQEQQLQRNSQRITELQEKIDAKQNELDQNIIAYHNTRMGGTYKKMDAEILEEDEVDDRTQQLADENALNPEGETEDSLLIKWNAIQSELKSVLGAIYQIETNLEKLQQRTETLTDEDELFFVRNDIQMNVEQKERFVMKQKELEERVGELERLLKIVNPRIQLHRMNGKDKGSLVEPDVSRLEERHGSVQFIPPAEISTSMPPPSSAASRVEPSMPPPPQFTRLAMPPPAFAAQVERSIPPPAISTAEPSVDQSRPDKRQRVIKGPAMPPPSVQPPVNSAKPLLNSEADVWRPPKDQDGSGRSKLNDKFGGRY
jgi:pSer/pThr/pTyr-binding forkhead associated (FHA) protein